MVPFYFCSFCSYSMLYIHFWGFWAKNCRRERTCAVCLSVSLLPHTIYFWISIHVTAKFMTLLFFTTEQYSFVCMYRNFIVHSSVEGYSGCSMFQMLWTEQQWTWLSRCLWSRVEVLCAYAEELASWAIWQISLSEDSPDWLSGWLLKFLYPLTMSFPGSPHFCVWWPLFCWP